MKNARSSKEETKVLLPFLWLAIVCKRLSECYGLKRCFIALYVQLVFNEMAFVKR